MASQLVWKVYNGERELVASTRYAEDAAFVVGHCALGTVRVDGRIVWRESIEPTSASESYDYAASIMRERRRENHTRSYAKYLRHRVDTVAAALQP